MPTVAKRQLLIFLFLFAAALGLIASSLPLLTLQPGLPMPYLGEGKIRAEVEPAKPPVEYDVNRFVIIVLIVLFALGLLWMIYTAIRGVGWKDLARNLLRFIIFFVCAAAVLALIVFLLPTTPPPAADEIIVIPTPPPVVTTPLGAPPAILTWLVGAILAVSAALLAVWFLRSRPSAGLALQRLGLEAEKARQALLTGASLRDVILQCYREMSAVLQEENGIQRQSFMTTNEFERLLAGQGFPAAAVHQLTHLFDAVRYSRWQPGLSDDQKAIDCLEAIVQYSRETRQAGENG